MDQIQDPGPAPWAMRQREGSAQADAMTSIRALARSIASEFELAMGRPEQVRDSCSRLRQQLSHPPTAAEVEQLGELIPLLSLKGREFAAPLFDLLAHVAAASHTPWPFLAGMLAARDPELGRQALELTRQLAESGMLRVDEEIAVFLAERVEMEGSVFSEDASLRTIGQLINRLPAAGAQGRDPVLALYRRAPGPLSRLAARLLDLDGRPASSWLAKELLGSDAHSFLHPYLDYTRASHSDLLHLVPERGQAPPALSSLRRAEATCGAELLREVIAILGWHRINLGLEVTPTVGVSIGGAIPFLISPAEARLIESCTDARRVSESFLFVAHGGLPVGQPGDRAQASAVTRFRAYNLAHAEILADILDVAPLTREKTRRILSRMDEIVSDFTALFAAMSEECEILPAVYADLKQRIAAELQNKEDVHPQLSPELTRLVQMFEDPGSLADVRTLHGLKRYLHQRGLKLGLGLVAAGLGTNRTVSLVVANRQRILRSLTRIEYVDFEPPAPETAAAPGTPASLGLPFPVAVLAQGYSTQLLHGQESFPSVKIFCYGNEVHYYIAFKNHPAFLRIDFSPPLKGGMIDLEYFGVSNYELTVHPNPSLDAIRLFFRRLEFDFQADGTRIHARYDKERALDLGDLCDAAGAMCRLIPYLMDVDWIIGSLDLDREARTEVARAWADRFARSGALPVDQLLTRDRRGILLATETGPAGEREVAWPGEGPYRDRFGLPSTELLAPLRAALEKLGLDIAPVSAPGESEGVGQIALERHLLRPLREAVARGELILAPDGFHPCPHGRFQQRHEAEELAAILSRDDSILASAALARLVAPLERTLRFRTTGSVNAYEVQRTRLPLLGEDLGLHVLRDAGGIIRLALFSHGESIFKRRDDPERAWWSNASLSALELATLLRRSNYLIPGAEPSGEWEREEATRIRETFQRTNPFEPHAPLEGESVLSGLRASPGRAVGKVLFSTAGRMPAEFDGAVLVAATVRPEDSIILHHAAGIVSTGGGILSHAGLIAAQLGKPALIVSGEWRDEGDGTQTLLHGTFEYREEVREIDGYRVTVWRDRKEREHRLREGALVVVDADAGALRVIGHDREALALHEELRLFAAASRHLLHATDENEILRLRGRQLQARYQMAKLLGRLRDPILARHAVHEILLGEAFEPAEARVHRAQLLSLVLDNPHTGPAARDGLLQIAGELGRRRLAARERAEHGIPTSVSVFEILWLRLAARRLQRILEGTIAALTECGLEAPPPDSSLPDAIDTMAADRLAALRRERIQALRPATAAPRHDARRRHQLRDLRRLDLLLGTTDPEAKSLAPCEEAISHADALACRTLGERRILGPEDGGWELHPLIGWKAANLAEVERLSGSGHVPPWFVITDSAFNQVLASSVEGTVSVPEAGFPDESTLGAAISAILARSDLSQAQKSARIRQLWDQVTLPDELIAEVTAAYRRLGDLASGGEDAALDPIGPFVAVRSSSLEEDTESAARAGEFDTFLFVRGEEPLLTHLRRAWSGLWTERAIHSRTALGLGADRTGGGVMVQHIVRSRVSGVLETVNVAEGEMREMVINAGLGLGEGIVSGTVAADQIVVAKGERSRQGPLRFRYITSDKRSQVVFNERAGSGTVLTDTLYHQRLRPALEYVELSELVAIATDLEATYGYPLDIEFGIEGTRLWILQVRPMAVYVPALRETLDHDPLGAVPSESTLPMRSHGHDPT